MTFLAVLSFAPPLEAQDANLRAQQPRSPSKLESSCWVRRAERLSFLRESLGSLRLHITHEAQDTRLQAQQPHSQNTLSPCWAWRHFGSRAPISSRSSPQSLSGLAATLLSTSCWVRKVFGLTCSNSLNGTRHLSGSSSPQTKPKSPCSALLSILAGPRELWLKTNHTQTSFESRNLLLLVGSPTPHSLSFAEVSPPTKPHRYLYIFRLLASSPLSKR